MSADSVIVKKMPVKKYRQNKALSKGEFCRSVGINEMTGSKVFNGKPVCLKTVKRIAAVIGVEPKNIILSWI